MIKTRYYQCIRDGKLVRLHRAVWEEHHGAIPKGLVVDHINHDPHDNRIENLRLIPQCLNILNQKRDTGVSLTPRKDGLRVYIRVTERIHLGTYPLTAAKESLYATRRQLTNDIIAYWQRNQHLPSAHTVRELWKQRRQQSVQ